MKKIISFIMTIFIALTISINGVSAEATTRVIDGAGLLSSEEKAALESTISSIKEKYKFDVVIVTTKDLEGKTPKAYAGEYYDKGKYGVGDNKDGVLLLLSPTTRDYYVSTAGFGIGAFTQYSIDYVGENIVSSLKDDNYYGAFEGFLSDAEMIVNQAKTSEPYSEDNPIVIGTNLERALGATVLFFPVSIIIALIIVFVMKRKHKTARTEDFASNYVDDNSFDLYINEDTFLNSNLSKTKISKESPSDNGGSGGSNYTSSSGQEHGGGGGKY